MFILKMTKKIQSWGGKTTFRIFTLFMKTKVPAVFELGFVGQENKVTPIQK